MKTTYKLNEFIAALKKWQEEGVKDICIDIDETGNEETQITAGSSPMKVLPIKGTSMMR